MAKFSAKKNKSGFKGLFIFIHVAMATTRQLNYQKAKLLVVIFCDQMIKVNETEVLKTVYPP